MMLDDDVVAGMRAMEKFPGVSPRIISDNGPQFISKDFKEFIRLSGFTHVRTALHHPQSNGKLERFHGTIKQEEIRKTGYVSIEDARRHLAAYIEHYNTRRLHSAIHYLTPEDVLLGRTEERLRVRQEKLDRARMHRILKCSETSTSVPSSGLATGTRSEPKGNHDSGRSQAEIAPAQKKKMTIVCKTKLTSIVHFTLRQNRKLW